MNRTKRALLPLLLLAGLTASAQLDDPVQWIGSARKVEGNRYEITITAQIDEGWHLYTTQLPEGGPLPTRFTFSNPTGYKLIGGVRELSRSKTEHDAIFNLNLSYFEHEAKFSQTVELLGGGATATIGVEYQACYADKCIYLEKELTVALSAEPVAGAETTARPNAAESPAATATTTAPPTGSSSDASLWVFFFIAFGAGLLGLLTPCVFPMIPMTVSFFMGKQGNRMGSIANALVFGLSIIVLYTSLGLVVSLFNLGADFATALTSHWITNTVFFLLFLAFAASFFGLFELVLPGSLASKTDSKADRGGFIGSFFMALTTVIVSLSCVGPIVGALLVEAASGLGAKPVVGMFGFALAFSIPFTLFAVFPSWLNSLPRSGGWMNSVKVVLGFVVLAFSLKFLTTIDQSYGLNLLSRDVFIAIWIVIAALLGLYLLGKLRFELDSEVKHVGVLRLFLAIASFTFAVYLVPGLFGAPLQAVSGLLPPQSSQRFDLTKHGGRPLAAIHGTGHGGRSSLCESPKYADKFHLPHGLQGYFDYAQALSCAKEKGKPLFVDFVGHTCANCKEMEAKVWSDPRVLERLSRDYIVVALYVDDRTELPESEWVTSPRDGRVKKTIGRRNADFQATRFNMNGQPYYALLDSNEQTLVEPRGYSLDVEEFVRFLDQGVEEFRKRQ